jgi:hypothetical protein
MIRIQLAKKYGRASWARRYNSRKCW